MPFDSTTYQEQTVSQPTKTRHPLWKRILARFHRPTYVEVLGYNPRSLAGFVAWLRTQDLSTTYCYTDSRDCLNAQYHRAHGMSYIGSCMKGIRWRDEIEAIAVMNHRRTYAGALVLAEKALAGDADVLRRMGAYPSMEGYRD